MAKTGTLAPNKVKTIGIGAYATSITVENIYGNGTIYFTVDGTQPTVGSETAYTSTDTTTVPAVNPNEPGVLRMISSTATPYSVSIEIGLPPEPPTV